MYRDERLCSSTSSKPFTLWRPSSGWVRRHGSPSLAFRVRCVDKSALDAETERCSRYEAGTEEHRTQCWTAGCMAVRDQCRPLEPPAQSRTPHQGEMAACIAHATEEACHAEPDYRCRFDHGMICVPNNVHHVPLHMQRRVELRPPKRTARKPPPPVFEKGERALLDGAPVTIADVRRKKRSKGIVYRVHNHSGAQLWVPEDMLHALPPSLADPYA